MVAQTVNRRVITMKIRTTIAAVLAALTVTAQAADRTLVIINDTSYTMYNFYASNVNRTSWEEDILGERVVSSGRRVRVDLDDGTGACYFDLKAVFSGNREVIKNNVNVCETSSWRIRD